MEVIDDPKFGDPDYHGVGPTVEEWKKYWEERLAAPNEQKETDRSLR